VHPPGVEPEPIAWKAIILPLDQECLMKESKININIIEIQIVIFTGQQDVISKSSDLIEAMLISQSGEENSG
jgi:hypothetical protein